MARTPFLARRFFFTMLLLLLADAELSASLAIFEAISIDFLRWVGDDLVRAISVNEL